MVMTYISMASLKISDNRKENEENIKNHMKLRVIMDMNMIKLRKKMHY